MLSNSNSLYKTSFAAINIEALNIEEQAGDLLSRSGGIIENVEDFIYLGSWIDGTERDINVRKGNTSWPVISSPGNQKHRGGGKKGKTKAELPVDAN